MGAIAIRAEGLSKRYRLGQLGRALSLKAAVSEAVGARVRSSANGDRHREIWALRDLSLEVNAGEVLGIIGPNGAGKSTLLKILTRITQPTAGRAEIHGRVGALIGVGIGFHPDLTGRENVYLNGAILGMKKAEIDRKFDEIVAFAEIDRFLETPVKRYSTGMYMRLAFAVAAHLESEILFVDEVLAVGDAAFQKKCLGRMNEIATEGRTILFVSHGMPAVQSLCHRAIWLDEGRIVADGVPLEVVGKYLRTAHTPVTERVWDDSVEAPAADCVRLRRVSIRPANGSPMDPITLSTPLVVEVEYWNLEPSARFQVSLSFVDARGVVLFKAAPRAQDERPLPVGLYRDVCEVPGDLLNDGVHRIELHVARDHTTTVLRKDDILVFEVLDTASSSPWRGRWQGAIRPLLGWRTELLQEGNGACS